MTVAQIDTMQRPVGVTPAIAAYIVGISYNRLPDTVIEKAKDCIFDNIGCAAAGIATRRGQILKTIAPAVEGGFPIIGSGILTSLLEAVFCNAMTANFLELDDSYDRPGSIMFSHPGATIIPVALALAQSTAASGRELIEAVVAGYEVCARVGAAVQPTFERAMNEVWGCATFQTFGAIAVAARLLKLDFAATLDALGIGGGSAPVSSTLKVWQKDRVDFHNGFGWAAQAGVRAGLLAAHGYTGPHDILDGNNGFWRMFGSDQCQFDYFTDGLGSKYCILDVSFKPWAACRWEHPVMDAAKLWRSQQRLKTETMQDVEKIERIEVKIFSAAIRSPYNNYRPTNLLEAQFSTPFCAAAAFLDIWPTEGLFNGGRLQNPILLAVMDKVVLVPDERSEKLFPGNGGDTLAAGFEVVIGESRHETFIVYPWGDRRNPMSREDLAAKFVQINEGRVSEHEARALQATVFGLDKAEELSALVEALRCCA